MTVKMGNTKSFAVTGSKLVVVPNAFTFTQDGEVVARVEATYNIARLPEELHHLFFQLVRQSCFNLVLPSIREAYEVSLSVPKRPWYQRLIDFFKGKPNADTDV